MNNLLRGSYHIMTNGREIVVPNAITYEGRRDYLDRVFGGTSLPVPAFYVGLVGAYGWVSQPTETDTLASHPNWQEHGGYDARQQITSWTSGFSGSSRYIESNTVTFTFSSSETFLGFFLCDVVSGTSGRMFSAAFYYDRSVDVDYTLTMKYRVTI